MHARPRVSVGPVLRRAVITPASLGLLATAGVLIGSPLWAGAVGLVLGEMLLLRYYVSNHRFIQQVAEARGRRAWRRQARRGQRLQARVDRETAAFLARIHSLQKQVVEQCPPEGGLLAPCMESMAQVLETSLRLAEKRHRLRTYLSHVQSAELQRQALQMENRLESCQDPVARPLLSQALALKRAELENYCAIHQALERIDGQLIKTEYSLGNMVGWLVRLRSADARHAETARERLTQQLAELVSSVTALEAAVNETLSHH